MDPRHLEAAAEFCNLTGKADLLDYLGLDAATSASMAQKKLKERRRYMQGMQANPKYKAEALALIKGFSAFNRLLEDPTGYHEAATRSRESTHLPVLEMAIRAASASGRPSPRQVEALRHNARELGIGDPTFEAALDRILAEQAPADADTVAPMGLGNDEHPDHYGVLGLAADATQDEIRDAYEARREAASSLEDRQEAAKALERLEAAWRVLGDLLAREAYDLSLRSTGPPARDRDITDPGVIANPRAPTAPPVRGRVQGPPRREDAAVPAASLPRGTMQDGGPQLVLVGPTARRVRVGRRPTAAEVRVRFEADKGSVRVSTDQPWLIAQPTRLEPGPGEQRITVRIDPQGLHDGPGNLTLQTDRGERASVSFELVKGRSLLPVLALALVALLGVVGVGWLALGWALMLSPGPLTILIDPTAERVVVDGATVGSGPAVVVDPGPRGAIRVEVEQPNFRPFAAQLHVDTRQDTLPVRLELAHPLDFRPTEEHRQAALDGDAARLALAPRSRGIDACVRGLPSGGEGSVRVHVGPAGLPIGVELHGAGADHPQVRECIERQAAAAVFPPLEEGDYATVRYDYQVPHQAR